MDDGGSPFDGGRFHYTKLGEPRDVEAQAESASVPPPGSLPVGRKPRRGRRLDRVVGILLGLVLGVGIVTAYVFLGSEDTIDAPRIQSQADQRPGEAAGEEGDRDGEADRP